MEINIKELSWAAGFFDGEGSTHLRKQQGKGRVAAVLISQVNRKNLERFQSAVGGIGNIYGPYKRENKNTRPNYSYQTGSFVKAQAIIAMLWSMLGSEKREQAKKALLACHNNPGRGPSDHNRKVNSELMKRRWADPAMREKMLAVIKVNVAKLADSRRGKPPTEQQIKNLNAGRIKRWNKQ